MNLLGILLLGVALSLDSFAVSLSLGFLCDRTTRREQGRFLLIIGIFHFLMIMSGWLLGENASRLIADYDHWIAFVLLFFLGGKMIKEGIFEKKDDTQNCALLNLRNTMLLGVALSIDALIAGFSLGLVRVSLFEGGVLANMLLAALLIGLCATIISGIGIGIGKKASARLGAKAEIFGGIILITIGLKVLVDHLM